MTNKNILILGGTGAMGTPLVELLSDKYHVWVTSRQKHDDKENVSFILGNAHDIIFLRQVCAMNTWDAIIDFMNRNVSESQLVFPLLLSHTNQYVFISSARVYAETDSEITENTPRLLDVSSDSVFLKTNEYSLAKAREEDLLMNGSYKNYTIIRPSITFNNHRLQLGALEKEGWLYRAIQGRSIVFSEDMKDKLTTVTWGYDVASGIAAIVGQSKALGEVFNITNNRSFTWQQILDVYIHTLEKLLHKNINVVWTEKSTSFKQRNQYYRLVYCRLFNRTFNNTKINQYVDTALFHEPLERLSYCLERFMERPHFKTIDWSLEGINDRVANERTPLNEIPNIKMKLLYLGNRYNIKSLNWLLFKIIKIRKQHH